MGKNLIPQIAKMLGVEIGEEFYLKNKGFIMRYSNFKMIQYRFTLKGLEIYRNREWCQSSLYLNDILSGEAEAILIFKLPYKPKENESYWTFTAVLDCSGEYTSQWAPVQDIWYGRIDDYMRLKLGMVYRTEAEAEAALPAKYEEVTGKEYCEE